MAHHLRYVVDRYAIGDEPSRVRVPIASTVTCLLPIVAVILGWIVLRETITATMLGGFALVLTGVALTRRSPAGSG